MEIINTWQQEQYTSSFADCERKALKILYETINHLESLNKTARENTELSILHLSLILNKNNKIINNINEIINEYVL